MGLDMYAYVANKPDAEAVDSNYTTQELAYWRKHPNLHGWMERLAKSKGLDYDTFNGVELELTFDDIIQLEKGNKIIINKEIYNKKERGSAIFILIILILYFVFPIFFLIKSKYEEKKIHKLKITKTKQKS